MRVHWSNKVVAQLADITDYLRQYSAIAAERMEDDLIAASERLGEFPQSGRAIPETNITALREVFVGAYRLVYVVGDFGIEILAVLHQAQRRG